MQSVLISLEERTWKIFPTWCVERILELIHCPIIQWTVIRPVGKLQRKQLQQGQFPEKSYLFENLKNIKTMFIISKDYTVINSSIVIFSPQIIIYKSVTAHWTMNTLFILLFFNLFLQCSCYLSPGPPSDYEYLKESCCVCISIHSTQDTEKGELNWIRN